MSLRFKGLLAVLVLQCALFGEDIGADAGKSADEFVRRAKKVPSQLAPISGMRQLLSDADRRAIPWQKYFDAHPQILDASERFGPYAGDGYLRFRVVEGQGGLKFLVSQDQLTAASDASMVWAYELIQLTQMRYDQSRGNSAWDRACAAMITANMHYRMGHPWSHKPEWNSLFYALKILNDAKSPGLNATVADLRGILANYGPLKSNANLLAEALKLVAESEAPPIPPAPGNPATAVDPANVPDAPTIRALDWLGPKTIAADGSRVPVPLEYRNAAAGMIDVMLKNPDQFAHLPGSFHLLRGLIAVAYGHVPTALALQNQKVAVTPRDPGFDAESARAKLAELRVACLRWFADEAKLRQPTAGQGEIYWDPVAASELFGVLADTSVPFAEKVRIPASRRLFKGADAVAQAVKEALAEDTDIQTLFQFPVERLRGAIRPEVRVLPNPASPAGITLDLRWTIPSGANRVDYVTLRSSDFFDDGGSGIQIPPGVVSTRLVKSRATPASKERLHLLLGVAKGDFLPALFDYDTLEPVERWYEVVDTNTVLFPNSIIQIRLADGAELAGTESQKVWAKPVGKIPEWTPLLNLREQDVVMTIDAGFQKIVGWRRIEPDPTVQVTTLEMAGTDHCVIERILCQCDGKKFDAKGKHGIVKDTLMTVRDRNDATIERSVSLDELSTETLNARLENAFIPCGSWSSKTMLSEKKLDDVLVHLARDQQSIIYVVEYNLSGASHTIGTARSHGFRLKNPEKGKKDEIAAHQLRPGMELCTAIPGEFAVVQSIAVVQTKGNSSWDLIHPMLLKGEWMSTGAGLQVHTDTVPLDAVGLRLGTEVATVNVSVSGEKTNWDVGKPKKVEDLVRGRREESDVLLVAMVDPRGPNAEFLPRHMSKKVTTIVPGLIEIKSATKTIVCTPKTVVWTPAGASVRGVSLSESRHRKAGKVRKEICLFIQPRESQSRFAQSRGGDLHRAAPSHRSGEALFHRQLCSASPCSLA